MKRLKKVISLVLTLTMLLSLCTFTARAEGPVAMVGTTEYDNIDDAVAAWTSETELTLIADYTVEDGETFAIPEGKNLSVADGSHLYVFGSLINNGTITGNSGSVEIRTMVYDTTDVRLYEDNTSWTVKATLNGEYSGEGTVSQDLLIYKISINGGSSWMTDPNDGETVAYIPNGSRFLLQNDMTAVLGDLKTNVGNKSLYLLKDFDLTASTDSYQAGIYAYSSRNVVIYGNGHTITLVGNYGTSNAFDMLKIGSGSQYEVSLYDLVLDNNYFGTHVIEVMQCKYSTNFTKLVNVTLKNPRNFWYQGIKFTDSSTANDKRGRFLIYDSDVCSFTGPSKVYVSVYGDKTIFRGASFGTSTTIFAGRYASDPSSKLAPGKSIYIDDKNYYVVGTLDNPAAAVTKSNKTIQYQSAATALTSGAGAVVTLYQNSDANASYSSATRINLENTAIYSGTVTLNNKNAILVIDATEGTNNATVVSGVNDRFVKCEVDGNVKTYSLVPVSEAVARVGENNYFMSLDEAFAAATGGETVTLQKDVTADSTVNTTATLSGNGHTVSGNITVAVNGSLSITGGTYTGAVTASEVDSLIITGGTFANEPSNYVPEETHAAIKSGSVWVVGEKTDAPDENSVQITVDDTTTVTQSTVTNADQENVTIVTTETTDSTTNKVTETVIDEGKTVDTDDPDTSATKTIVVTDEPDDDVEDAAEQELGNQIVDTSDYIYIRTTTTTSTDPTAEPQVENRKIPVTAAVEENTNFATQDNVATVANDSVVAQAKTYDTDAIVTELAKKAVENSESLTDATRIGYGMEIKTLAPQSESRYEIRPVAIAYKPDGSVISRTPIAHGEATYTAPVPTTAADGEPVRVVHMPNTKQAETFIVAAKGGYATVPVSHFSEFSSEPYTDPYYYTVYAANEVPDTRYYTEVDDWDTAVARAIEKKGTLTLYTDADDKTIVLDAANETLTIVGAQYTYGDSSEYHDYYALPTVSADPAMRATHYVAESGKVTGQAATQFGSQTRTTQMTYTLKAHPDNYNVYVSVDDTTQYATSATMTIEEIPVYVTGTAAFKGVQFDLGYDNDVFSEVAFVANGGYIASCDYVTGTNNDSYLRVVIADQEIEFLPEEEPLLLGTLTLTMKTDETSFTSSDAYLADGDTPLTLSNVRITLDPNDETYVSVTPTQPDETNNTVDFKYIVTIVGDVPTQTDTPSLSIGEGGKTLTTGENSWSIVVDDGDDIDDITVTGKAKSGYYVTGITGTGVTGTNEPKDTFTFEMPKKDVTVTVHTAPKTFTVVAADDADFSDELTGTAKYGETYTSAVTIAGFDTNVYEYTVTVTSDDETPISISGTRTMAGQGDSDKVQISDDEISDDGTITFSGSEFADAAQGATLTVTVTKKLASCFVEAYPLSGNLILLKAYSPANVTLDYNGVQMYKDARFDGFEVQVGDHVYPITDVYVILIDAARAQRSLGVAITLDNVNETGMPAVAQSAKQFVTISASTAEKSITSGDYNTNGVANDGVNGNDDVGVADVTLAYQAYLAQYRYAANSRTGIVSAHDTKYLLSDATLTASGNLDTLFTGTTPQSALLTLKDVDYVYIASLGLNPAVGADRESISRVGTGNN